LVELWEEQLFPRFKLVKLTKMIMVNSISMRWLFLWISLWWSCVSVKRNIELASGNNGIEKQSVEKNWTLIEFDKKIFKLRQYTVSFWKERLIVKVKYSSKHISKEKYSTRKDFLRLSKISNKQTKQRINRNFTAKWFHSGM
jgi:hypothetical protein